MRATSLALWFALASPALLAQTVTARGIQEFQAGRYAAALATLRQAVQESPSDVQARTFLALTQAAAGECATAVQELRTQSENNADAAVRRLAGLGAVQCLLAANDYRAAMPILDRLATNYPSDADVLYEAAKAYNKAWNATVFEMYRQAPASFRVNQISAEVFETQGRYSEAAAEYRKAVEKGPAVINLHFRLGRAILLQSHDPSSLEEARKQFEAELALNPSDAASEYQLGQIFMAQQNDAQAAPHFARAVALSPAFPEALVALAKLKQNARKYDEAVALLQRAIQAAPKMEAAHYALLMTYRDAGRMDEARREKAELDRLQKPPEGEFTDFLKRLGEKAPKP